MISGGFLVVKNVGREGDVVAGTNGGVLVIKFLYKATNICFCMDRGMGSESGLVGV